ncbi:MAG: NnrS family protein [Chromatiales bacterium]|nr:MAG: NnrS family protein [Chromatiales bacterium]
MARAHPSLLSYAFRPFFLCNGWFAMGIMVLWVLGLHGISTAGMGSTDPLWHAHEMLFGFVMAAIAGFALTAVATWTGRPPVHGPSLAWLLLAWLAGRAAMLWAMALPTGLRVSLDLLFPVLLTLVFAREVIAGGSRRNLPVVAIVGLLAMLNLGYHLGALHLLPGFAQPAIYLAMHVILLLITVIAGRIVPSFTANWLRAQGEERLPTPGGIVEPLVILATLGTGIAASLAPGSSGAGGLALVAAVLHGLRLARWRGLATTSEPLVLVLHLAYAWFPVGYALLAAASFTAWLPSTAAIHALAMGVIGSMILAVTTRVALGHTGRPLRAAPLTVLAYGVFTLAVVARVLGPFSAGAYLTWIDVAALGWVVSFALFSWVYWPILTGPRPDA